MRDLPLLMVRFLHVLFFFFFVALPDMLIWKLDSLYVVDIGMDFNLGATMDSWRGAVTRVTMIHCRPC